MQFPQANHLPRHSPDFRTVLIEIHFQCFFRPNLLLTLPTLKKWLARAKIMDGKNLKSSAPLACVVIGSKWGLLTCFHSEKLIFPFFSSLRGGSILVSFPGVRIRKETEISLQRTPRYTLLSVLHDEMSPAEGKNEPTKVKAREKTSSSILVLHNTETPVMY